MLEDEINKLIHSPKRLEIMGALAEADWLAFKRVRAETGLDDSSLSRQLGILNKAGLLQMRKTPTVVGRQTWVSLTPNGRESFRQYSQIVRRLLIEP